MKQSGLEKRLYEAISRLEVVDAHEHLPPERDYLAQQYCGPNFFAGYVWHDLSSAGLPREIKAALRDPGPRPVESWWPQIAPYWAMVKEGSFARAARVTARDLYGIEEINDDTIHDLAARITADNTPGLYHRILRWKCNIRAAVTNQTHAGFRDDPLLRPVVALEPAHGWTWAELLALAREEKIELKSFEDLLETVRQRLVRQKRDGVVGLKAFIAARTEPTEDQARDAFDRIRAIGPSEDVAPLADFLFWQSLGHAALLGLPIAVHAGVWGDFRTLNPSLITRWAMRCPDTQFDLFHIGIPNAREAAVIGKNFSNVTLNLCWSYVISQRLTLRTLDELIDLVPLNKIIAFGGDYRCVVQKVYGHLVMARETVARALARRVEDGDFSESRALDIARMWFHDNPARIYRV